jgi:hypothetical protein
LRGGGRLSKAAMQSLETLHLVSESQNDGHLNLSYLVYEPLPHANAAQTKFGQTHLFNSV